MEINFLAILIANLMSISILFCTAMSGVLKYKNIFKEQSYIKYMIIVTFISSVIEPICFILDGRPGLFHHIAILLGSTFLFIFNIIIGYSWIKLIVNHLNIKIPKLIDIILQAVIVIQLIMLAINLFIPIVFKVDSNNRYSRTNLFWVYSAIYIIYMALGVIAYYIEINKKSKIKFFPVWAFIIPAIFGMVIQSVFYGVSTITPFVSVSIVCILISLQSDFMFKDQLTGLYNRFYLQALQQRKSRKEYVAMMLDLNEFKQINDEYGHNAGDAALIKSAVILKKIVGLKGDVIRFAGDEFIIILKTDDDKFAKELENQIHHEFNVFSNREDATYKLSISIGYSKISLDDDSINMVIDKIDKLMYNNKDKYYGREERY